MNQTTKLIFNEAINLPPIDRAELIECIIESFDTKPDDEIQKVWADEAERRLMLHKNGDCRSIPEEEVFERIERLNKK
jgi:putative addiction module component (TIGR02574 family)